MSIYLFFNRVKKANSIEIRELLYTGFAQGIYILESVVQNKIFTSFFPTSIYGKWSLLLSAYTLISMLPFTAFDQGINRVAASYRREGKDRMLYNAISIVYFSFFLFYIILLSLLGSLQKDSFFARGCLVAFILYTVTEIYKNTFILVDNAYRNRKRTLIIRLFEFISRTILLFLLYSLNIFTIKNVLFLLFGTNVIIIIYQQLVFKTKISVLNLGNTKSIVRDIWLFSYPLLTWAIFGWMQNMISKWYLDAFLDLDSVAMYSVLTSLSYFVPSSIYSVFNAYITPIAFEKNTEITRKKLLLYLGVVWVLELLYVIFVFFFGKTLILVLTSSNYLPMVKYLPYTTLTASLYVLAMLSTIEVFRQNKTKKLIGSTIMPGILMSTIGFFLIRKHGLEGSVVNYMMGHISYAILTSIVVFTNSHFKGHNNETKSSNSN